MERAEFQRQSRAYGKNRHLGSRKPTARALLSRRRHHAQHVYERTPLFLFASLCVGNVLGSKFGREKRGEVRRSEEKRFFRTGLGHLLRLRGPACAVSCEPPKSQVDVLEECLNCKFCIVLLPSSCWCWSRRQSGSGWLKPYLASDCQNPLIFHHMQRTEDSLALMLELHQQASCSRRFSGHKGVSVTF